MWSALQHFLQSQLLKIGGLSIKGVHLVVITTVLVAGAGAGVGVYITNHNSSSSSQARTVVVTINGVNTSLDANCQYSRDANGKGTFDDIDQALVHEGFTDPYQAGCPTASTSTAPAGTTGSDAGSRLDIAEYSYADSPGQMLGGHWAPDSFTACAPNTNSLEKDSQNLAALLDAYHSAYPDAHFELVGHSLGGLVALQGATDYVKDGHAHDGLITKVITLDSPLHGRSANNVAGAALVTEALNIAGECPFANSLLGQAFNALAQGQGNLAENDAAILAAHGAEVYTLGNLDDCLYQRGVCPAQVASLLGAAGGGAALLAIPDETSSQFIAEAYQRQYHLGQAGSWPGGHGAILTDEQSVADIAWLLAHAPSAAISAITPDNAPPQLHVFATGPERGIQNVTVQLTSSDGNVVQQLSLDGNGAVAYTDDLTLDARKIGLGTLTASITTVTDSQNLQHLPQTVSDGSESIRHDFLAQTSFTSTYQPAGNGATPTPSLSSLSVYVGASDGTLRALNASDGTQRWSFKPSEQMSTVTVAEASVNGIVYVEQTAENGSGQAFAPLYAVSASSGTLLWQWMPPAPPNMVAQDESGPPSFISATGNTVFVAAYNLLIALDAQTGRVRWQYDTSNLNWSVLSDGKTVFVGNGWASHTTSLDALDIQTGGLQWHATMPGSLNVAMALADGIVYMGICSSGYSQTPCDAPLSVYAFDTSTQAQIWHTGVGTGSQIINLQVADNRVFTTVSGASQSIVALDAHSGAQLPPAPATCGAMGVFAGGGPAYEWCASDTSATAQVIAYDPASGQQGWSQSTLAAGGQTILTIPAVSAGLVYVNDANYGGAEAGNSDVYTAYALDTGSGSIRWQHSGVIEGIQDGIVVLTTGDGMCIVVNTSDGSPRWQFDTGVAASPQLGITIPALLAR